jgi:hypothetical protein
MKELRKRLLVSASSISVPYRSLPVPYWNTLIQVADWIRHRLFIPVTDGLTVISESAFRHQGQSALALIRPALSSYMVFTDKTDLLKD